MEDLVAHVLSRCQSPQERGRAASITAHIFLGVGKTCRDQTSSSVKLEVCCGMEPIIPCPWGCAAKCKLQFR
jgi:hypothetical protein